MKIHQVEPAKKLSFYSDCERFEKDNIYKLEIGEGDIFLATSWWSAKAISETISGKFFYIIQEVETFFYNYSDQHLACSQIMNSDKIHFIVNSSYLYKYFEQNEPNISKNGIYFEPAFPHNIYKTPKISQNKKQRLFFYARPNHPRNLYAYGVYLLDLALQKKIIDPNEWEIYFAGSGSECIEFSDGTKCINLGQLTWREYADFLQTVDLGISLMYTPHPSYPPYDIACSGGVVLSNRMFNKTKFKECENVILSDLNEKAFMNSFKKAVLLSKDLNKRKLNYEQNKICRDWHKAFANTIGYMEKCINAERKK